MTIYESIQASWGGPCVRCGHPASYHTTTACMVTAGAERKMPCDCSGYGLATADRRLAVEQIREALMHADGFRPDGKRRVNAYNDDIDRILNEVASRPPEVSDE